MAREFSARSVTVARDRPGFIDNDMTCIYDDFCERSCLKTHTIPLKPTSKVEDIAD